MHKERQQRASHNQGHAHHHIAPYTCKQHAETDTRRDAIATRIAVHTVDQVHHVNQTNAHHQTQQNRHPEFQLIDAPQAVETVDIDTSLPHEDSY